MTDLWSFLLQTLTASGVAALLLAVKAMFRDKLSPRWQFGIWGVLALVLLLPAGWGGRYVLVNWPMWVEALKSALTGQFGTLTRVIAPVPLPRPAPPRTAADWLYLLYLAGAAVLLARYLISYVRLRRALKRGRPGQNERVRTVAERYGLPVCPAVEVDGLPTAFVCGVFRPVLALPAGKETDEKVILHELLHLKYKDVLWGWLIALLRCLHWCNPLLWLCADRAGNDLEALCDQRVLERLEGEERRDYGRILLSMADEKYARAPGTSSAANGGKNIARRIQAIARFKRYPAGMALASVCVALVLAFPLVVGARAEGVGEWGVQNTTVVMASARTTYCTTYAGAFDAYAKALLTGDISYRAMCAPLSGQNELAQAAGGYQHQRDTSWLWNQAGDVRSSPSTQEGYRIYNLTPTGDGGWEGLLVLPLEYLPNDDVEWVGWDNAVYSRWLAVQTLRAEREEERWVVIPQEKLHAVPGDQRREGNLGLPSRVYEAQYGDWLVRAQWQTAAAVNSQAQNSPGFWYTTSFDLVPKPHAQFDEGYADHQFWAIYTGAPDKKGSYISVGFSVKSIYKEGYQEPESIDVGLNGGSNIRWDTYGDRILEGDWEDMVSLSGSSIDWSTDGACLAPEAYQVFFYLNGILEAELTLLPVEGGEWIEPGA